MRKIGYVCLVLVLACLLWGCSGEAEPNETTAPEMQATETVAPTTEPVIETEPPTEPVGDRAREMIRSGDYQGALDLLESEEGNEETEFLQLRAELGEIEVGGQIMLGSYEQDGDMENGPEEIAWIVLAKEDNRAFLLSLYCLDTRPYHDVIDGAVTWAESPMRTWLNEDFCSSAFTDVEQRLLAETELVTPDNPMYHTPGGENTVDRVFLLSLEEVETYLTKEQCLGQVTQYAIKKGCYYNASFNGWWWLRSSGTQRRDACYVDAMGKASLYGYVVHRPGWSVRPAMWIDLEV